MPLTDFINRISDIVSRKQEDLCISVIDRVQGLPIISKKPLEKAHEIFKEELLNLKWHDLERWIVSWIDPYQDRLQDLAVASRQAHNCCGANSVNVTIWNNFLRQIIKFNYLKEWIRERKILCAFSPAVDANYPLDENQDLEDLLIHAAEFLEISVGELLNKVYQEYARNFPPQDRSEVSTVVEVIAEIIYGYQHPRANLKPTIKPESEAERWFRAFHFNMNNDGRIEYTGGGASLNIADALAGLGILVHVFWPYHGKYLAVSSLFCCQGNNILRCFFDDKWNWKHCDFNQAGNESDGTGHEHPTRMSIIFPFSLKSPAVNIIDVNKTYQPTSQGRVIFQIKGYRSDEFFSSDTNPYETYESIPLSGRWRWKKGISYEIANDNAMQNVKKTNYNRVILSAFQYANIDDTKKLAKQCKQLKIHHEISSVFDDLAKVEKYCNKLLTLYKTAEERTAGMNAEELTMFTSWMGTEVFVAAPPMGKESLIQSFIRALKVREVFKLNWLYIHGNDIDISVTSPDYPEQNHEKLRNAMLFAKVAVFAALHLRSDLTHAPNTFEPSCSPKGFIALYQFAKDFANQFGHSHIYRLERNALQSKLIQKGYICGYEGIPNVIIVPVYWPDPLEGCSMTGAGDITSGTVAALAP